MRRAIYRVVVDGQDITSRVMPRLIDLSFSDKEGASSDALNLTLDNKGAALVHPPAGVEIAAFFGWEDDGDPPLRFVGTVDEVRSGGGRGQGRTLSISAKGIDTRAKAKSEAQKHWDDATFGTVITDAAKAAGFTSVRIDPDLAKLERVYWHQASESFLQFAQRLSDDLGGTFKIQGKAVTIAKRGSGRSASGAALPTIRAAVGENLHSWEISPDRGRPRFEKVKARFYDQKEARYREVEAEIENDDTPATKTIDVVSRSEEEAQQLADAEAIGSARLRGGGSIVIEGDGDASPEGKCVLVGADPGLDGEYTIADVEHSISRGSGWTTTLNVVRPTAGVGEEDRKRAAKSPASASSSVTSRPASMPADERLAPRPDRLGLAGPTLAL